MRCDEPELTDQSLGDRVVGVACGFVDGLRLLHHRKLYIDINGMRSIDEDELFQELTVWECARPLAWRSTDTLFKCFKQRYAAMQRDSISTPHDNNVTRHWGWIPDENIRRDHCCSKAIALAGRH